MGPDTMILVFWMLSFKPIFSLSFFNFIKRLFSSSSLSATRVVSSAYLRLLIFLPALLIPEWLWLEWLRSSKCVRSKIGKKIGLKPTLREEVDEAIFAKRTEKEMEIRVSFKWLVMAHKYSNEKDHILLMSTYDFHANVVILGKWCKF